MSLENRYKKITDKHIQDFICLTHAILKKYKNKNLSGGDVSHLKEIISRQIHSKDGKIASIGRVK